VAGISVEIDTDGLGTRLPPKVEVALFRILQESFADIAKHAGATHVRVRVARTDETVRAVVADNGVRFEPAEGARAGEGRAIGVFAMRERAAMIGGHVSAHTLPDAGTRIDIVLPCSEVPVESANASLMSPAFS
jgi:two-component system sensor histidine kinase UhpB